MFKKILVPSDGSASSEKTIRAAVEMAKMTGGQIIGISVGQMYPSPLYPEGGGAIDFSFYQNEMKKWAEQNIAKISEIAGEANVPCQTLITEGFNPYEEIIKAANTHQCDVIFMASHGRSGLNRLLLGSETQKVLSHSTIPVCIFR